MRFLCCYVVSGTHARLQKKDGDLLVTDLGSTNGTFIDEKRLTPGVPSVIPSGRYVTFGPIFIPLSTITCIYFVLLVLLKKRYIFDFLKHFDPIYLFSKTSYKSRGFYENNGIDGESVGDFNFWFSRIGVHISILVCLKISIRFQ